jgi:hypothetical protein
MRKIEMTGVAHCGALHPKGRSLAPRSVLLPEINKMLRKILMARVAATAIAVIAVPSDASARGRGGGGGGFHGGGFHGGGGFRGGGFYGGGYRGGYRGFGYRGYYPLYGAAFGLGFYGAYNYGCYRTVRVFTPYGPLWRRVWVCGY